MIRQRDVFSPLNALQYKTTTALHYDRAQRQGLRQTALPQAGRAVKHEEYTRITVEEFCV